jgi:hypothetical protein
MKIYLDTSVFGGYFEKEFSRWSKKLIDNILSGEHSAVVSDITLAELETAPIYVREIAEKIVTHKYRADTLHIAIATIHQVDVLASWNFKHIVNLNRIKLYNSINIKNGYRFIEIRSPKDLVEL